LKGNTVVYGANEPCAGWFNRVQLFGLVMGTRHITVHYKV
jgi:hypothetical protein